jgi:D-alanyl-D-alanine carboxypeptidase
MVTASSSAPYVDFHYGPQPRLSQPDFFLATLNSFKETKQSFVEADLSSMMIRYYDQGVVVFESKILSKGKEGSWWETPAGLYAIQSKTPKHFSSFGRVYQPWSMVFQGNFFIHGWPYYPDGTPVASTHSGGCIRLDDVHAKKLYDLVSEGTPVLVYESQEPDDTFTYEAAPPEIHARAYMVADVESGTILVEHQSLEPVPIASITKLMTALIASEYINLDKDVVITEAMRATTSVPRFKPNMKMTAYSLLFPLLLESSNEAAVAFGSLLGQTRFVSLMNAKADALGMEDTVFVDTSGALAGNISTAQDLVRLGTYLYDNRSFILKISSGVKVHSAYETFDFGTLKNFNETPNLSGLVGGKVGKTTAAQETAIVLYKMNIKNEERILAFVVLGTPDRYEAVQRLYAYIEDQYQASPSANVP